MATIQANAHKDLPEFLTALAAANAAGDKFDTENLTRALIPNRALSTMPKATMTSDSGVTLPAVTPTADGWLYKDSFPQNFGQFLMDFQAVAATDRTVESVVMTRTKLKPYAVLNVKFSETPAVSLKTDLTATKTAAVGANATFKVVAQDGKTPYTYAWYYNDANGGADTLIDSTVNPTAATDTLVNSAVTTASSGNYWCIVSDSSTPAGTVTSKKCKLTVS